MSVGGFYDIPTARVIFTVKTSFDVFSLGREQVWTFSVLGDQIYEMRCLFVAVRPFPRGGPWGGGGEFILKENGKNCYDKSRPILCKEILAYKKFAAPFGGITFINR